MVLEVGCCGCVDRLGIEMRPHWALDRREYDAGILVD